jgi:hypothetical protein
MLKGFVGELESGLTFATRTGRQLWQQNILRRSLHPTLADLKQSKPVVMHSVVPVSLVFARSWSPKTSSPSGMATQ